MNNFFENKLTYNQTSFCHTNKATVEEREIHSYYEILFYMDTETSFFTESFSKKIKKHTLVIIPKEKYHYLDNKKFNSFERLKISISSISEFENIFMNFEDICVIDKIDETIQFALDKICTGLINKEKYGIYGAFLILLNEISKVVSHGFQMKKNNSEFVTECVDVINNYLTEDISIEFISKKLNVSKSTITHSFKKEMGISILKYIQQKRMIYAKKLIDAGNKPTKIYFDCGYTEYSAFYKAYCKMFGCPPSK